LKAGQIERGLSVIAEALAASGELGKIVHESELHRTKGELLLRQDSPNAGEAERCFRTSIEMARRQGSKSFELRATASLAELLGKQGKREEARTMLARIYNWFTEGFDTADLKDAKALLDELRLTRIAAIQDRFPR
jgi:predicted ATPase